MTSDTRSPNDIERDIVEERARMTGTINDLQQKFSVEAIMNDLGGMLRDQGGDIGRTISQTIGRNPPAVALVGVGLAWLFLGQDRKDPGHEDRGAGRGSYDRPGSRAADVWDSRAAPRGRSGAAPSQDRDRFWFDGDAGGVAGQRGFRRPDVEEADHGGDAWDAPSNGVVGAIRNTADAVADTVSDAAGSVRDGAARMTDRLSQGTEDLSEEARARVLAARQAAHDARDAAQDAASRGGRAAVNLFEDQPLVVGALALAFGAALGGALPHSRIEDEAVGETSDKLFADAQAIFREERDKAAAVLKTAAQDTEGEVRKAGSDLAEMLPDGKTAGDVVVDRVATAGSRVLDGVRTEADRQDLGRRDT